ncbi:hypothetical protein KEM48_004783 [Puccinia striiformis f. sp. tritici PST-130]|nr:hypothetical protein KEM48_004783 [Puccinia striiformis f. sp. tritici PST-130]
MAFTCGKHETCDPSVIYTSKDPGDGRPGPWNQPGAFLHHQDSLRDQLHQISDLNNHIRHSELAHQRERALVDRTAAELARQSLTDELRRSEAARERDLALADQQVSQLAQHSLAKDLRRNEIAHQRELALADQRASQLSQQSVVQAVRENEVYRELAHQRHQLDLGACRDCASEGPRGNSDSARHD